MSGGMTSSLMGLGKLGGRLTGTWVAIGIALLVGATIATAKSGNLDSSFGRNGRVLGPQEEAQVDTAVLPNGEIIVAGQTRVYGYRQNGTLDRGFGSDGALLPIAPSGRRVVIQGVAVTRDGRIVVVGSAGRPAGSGEPAPGEALSYAVVERFLPDGSPDSSFGDHGALATDFSLPAPIAPIVVAPPTPAPPGMDIEASGVAIDGRGRIVVTGTRATTYEYVAKNGQYVPRREAFIARLAANGDRDLSFGGDGTMQLGRSVAIGAPVVDSGDAVFVTANEGGENPEIPRPALLWHVKAGGAPDSAFADGGRKSLKGFDGESRIGVVLDREGRPLLFTRGLIERLKTDGRIDRRFGRRGTTKIKIRNGEVSLADLAVTRSNRLLGVGTVGIGPTTVAGRTQRLLLVRLNSDGQTDDEFGKNGAVTTAFGKAAQVSGETVVPDAHGAIVGGTAYYGARPPTRIVLARYLLGG